MDYTMSTFGPYDHEEQTYGEPMPAEVAALHASGRVRSGDLDHLVHNAQARALFAALLDAGVEVGSFDCRILIGLAGLEPSTVQVLIGIISRARRRDG